MSGVSALETEVISDALLPFRGGQGLEAGAQYHRCPLGPDRKRQQEVLREEQKRKRWQREPEPQESWGTRPVHGKQPLWKRIGSPSSERRDGWLDGWRQWPGP